MKNDMLRLIISEIQSLGVRVPAGVLQRKGGAGPAEAGFIVLEGIPVSVPVTSSFVKFSPYHIRFEGGGAWLMRENVVSAPVNLIGRPSYYSLATSEGIKYEQIALMHGLDCLATSVVQYCYHWRSGNRCRFCGIEISLAAGKTLPFKSPSQLAEVAAAAKELDGAAHVVLTAGTAEPPGSELNLLSDAASAVRDVTGLPVHAQFLPPEDLGWLERLKEKGVATVGIHLENPDLKILSKVSPAKGAIGKDRYTKTWKRAVEVFGPNQVSSFLIAGLGENLISMVSECEAMADMGVYPFVVPLRPIPGSLMEDALPPAPSYMNSIYEKVSELINLKGLSSRASKAGCVRCGACSGLPAYESENSGIACHAVRTSMELEMALALRRDVFVREQGLFKETDEDENDARSIHLLAEEKGAAIGTVRVFQAEGEPSHWIGGRLAIAKSKRANGAGELLVREAVKTVKGLGCKRFTAMIQEENVPFFKRLGWHPIAETQIYRGRLHRMMEADLDD